VQGHSSHMHYRAAFVKKSVFLSNSRPGIKL
jgi:hypothetical protein